MKLANLKITRREVAVVLMVANVFVWNGFLGVFDGYSDYLRTRYAYAAYNGIEQSKMAGGEVLVLIAAETTYKYNERVPEDEILSEMHVLAERFNINAGSWEKLLRCESTCTKRDTAEIGCEVGKISNLLRNPISTAVGPGQYLIGTWYETESWKQFRCARTDHKCSLWEMALDIANGEARQKWEDCTKKYNIF